jgi:acyl-CoA synthetase (AMP-forming)/AMP-acid ligase II
MLLEQFKKNPTALALDDLSTTRSWEELESNALRLASFIKLHGVLPGEHVALLMRNRVEFMEVVVAALFAGVWLTPINWHLTDDEIHYIVQDCDAKLLISESYFEKITHVAAVESIDIDMLKFNHIPKFLLELDQEPGAIMMYTSGTTGKPKGVKRAKPETLNALLSQQALSGKSVGLDGSGAHLVTGPLYHAAPMLYALYDLCNGAPMIIMPRFDALAALQLIALHNIVHSHWVPTMFVRALRHRDQYPQGLPSLTLVLHGAAPVTIDIKRQMIDWWGLVLDEYWGGTESGVVTRIDSQQWLAHPGSVGRALPQFEIVALDEAGKPLSADKAGLLSVKHKAIARPFSYHRAEEKTAHTYLSPGVFSIGDIGRIDEEGFVYLLDRESHMIIAGGVNIYPAEIESILQQHCAVEDVAVFGIPNDEWGEEVKAVIELAATYSESKQLRLELNDYARANLAAYKVPRSFDFADQLPRLETGKLLTRVLKQPYWQNKNKLI